MKPIHKLIYALLIAVTLSLAGCGGSSSNTAQTVDSDLMAARTAAKTAKTAADTAKAAADTAKGNADTAAMNIVSMQTGKKSDGLITALNTAVTATGTAFRALGPLMTPMMRKM